MRVGLFILVVLFSLMGLGHVLAGEKDFNSRHDAPEFRCSSVREYVTALEFMKDHKEMALNEKQMRDVAEKVSAGCTGSALRFIRVTSALLSVEVGSQDAVKNGMDFVTKTDAHVDTFLTIFRQSFLRDGFDLDLRASMKLARELSLDYQGDTKIADKDFEELVKFCTSAENLDLPKPVCATMAARLVKKGEGFKSGIAASYVKAFEFVRSPDGPALATDQALKIAEEVISVGPESVDNFIQGYKYGLSEKGLALDQKDAIKFARQMTTLTRAPASTK